jgi:hypothetical protein
MFIKVVPRNSGLGEHMFECAHFNVRPWPIDRFDEYTEGSLLRLENDIGEQSGIVPRYVEIQIHEKSHRDFMRVVTSAPVYAMNGAGQTVDRWNQ